MSTQYIRAKSLLEAELEDEIVGLDVDQGHCFGFNSVAADIWRLLDEPRDLETLQQLIMNLYDVDPDECAAELKSCIADLESKGLVRKVGVNQ